MPKYERLIGKYGSYRIKNRTDYHRYGVVVGFNMSGDSYEDAMTALGLSSLEKSRNVKDTSIFNRYLFATPDPKRDKNPVMLMCPRFDNFERDFTPININWDLNADELKYLNVLRQYPAVSRYIEDLESGYLDFEEGKTYFVNDGYKKVVDGLEYNGACFCPETEQCLLRFGDIVIPASRLTGTNVSQIDLSTLAK